MNLSAVTYLTQLDDVTEDKMFFIKFQAPVRSFTPREGRCTPRAGDATMHLADEGPAKTRQGSLSAGISNSLEAEAEADQHTPLMGLPSLLVAEKGSASAGMISRISSLEQENMNLKHRLALLEAKIASYIDVPIEHPTRFAII